MERVYSVTPEVFLSRFRPDVLGLGRRTSVEASGFTCPRRPLEGTQYTYQLAIARTMAAYVPPGSDVPKSTDYRSGVVVFDGNKIVGSYIATTISRRLAVAKAYRKQGLAARMLELWYRDTAFVRASVGSLNAEGASSAIEAYKRTVQWAIDAGKGVPAEVREAVADPARIGRSLNKLQKQLPTLAIFSDRRREIRRMLAQK